MIAAVVTNLDGVAARVAKMEPDGSELLDQAGKVLAASARERVGTTKTSPTGRAWARWAPSTARRRRGELMNQSGVLMASIRSIAAGDDEVEIGSSDPVAKILSFGFKKRGGIGDAPARPIFGISKEDEEAIEGVALSHLQELVS